MSARPALTLLALWFGIASAVAVGIVAGFLILRLVIPDVAIAASRAAPNASGVSALQADVATEDAASGLPGAPLDPAIVPATASGDVRPVGVPAPSASSAHTRCGALPEPCETAARPEGSGLSMAEHPIVLAARSGTRVAGTASWWASFGPGIYAALPGYVAGTHVTIRVCAGSRCVVSSVITSCQCLVGTPDARVVDLSRDAFARLADPSRGLVPVTVETVQ
jgi:hypothetical protein